VLLVLLLERLFSVGANVFSFMKMGTVVNDEKKLKYTSCLNHEYTFQLI
jgi:hypothetical protein